ncbi:Exodeoxyribonuclease III [bacterium HR40]|nr:Exodeoxyribonuclease III [bacterium HR40]
MTIVVATWNVNSIKARESLVLGWLGEVQPDVLLMQEIKCTEDAFPRQGFARLGYGVAVVGQKNWNGVAVASRHPIEELARQLPGEEDAQARYLEVRTAGLRVASLYLPNGNPVGSDKFAYKLRWLERLRHHAACLLEEDEPLVLGGDYNVIPETIDCHDPAAWQDDALFRPESRRGFRALLWLGLYDAFRALHPEDKNAWTFWDYQGGAFQLDHGIRIDHLLLSPQAVDRLRAARIDRRPRAMPKASDHTPVLIELD